MENEKILVVDDDADLVKAISAILENQKYQVVTASNKTEGMEKVKSEKPDLVILDVMMTEMQEGFEMSRELKKASEYKDLPIILLTSIDKVTGVNFKSAFGNTEMLPVDGYIEKPVVPHVLLAEVKKQLSK